MRIWRVCSVALAYSSFGAGGLMILLVAFPLLRLFVRDPHYRKLLARQLIQRSFALFVVLLRVLGIMTCNVQGLERLNRRGLLILANHPTLLDVVILIAHLPDADCVVKAALLRNPFTYGPVSAAGYLMNDDGPGLVEDCIVAVQNGGRLVIFPEGTRTRRNEPMRLQRGAANIAVRGGLDITPVRITCEPMFLGKGEKWYHVPLHGARYTLRVCDDIPVRQFLSQNDEETVAVRRLTEYLTRYFSGAQASAAT